MTVVIIDNDSFMHPSIHLCFSSLSLSRHRPLAMMRDTAAILALAALSPWIPVPTSAYVQQCAPGQKELRSDGDRV